MIFTGRGGIVIPAKAGIHLAIHHSSTGPGLDSRLHANEISANPLEFDCVLNELFVAIQ